jgi:integrase
LTLCDFLCDFYGVKRNASQSTKGKSQKVVGNHREGRFLPVKDSRKRKVRGMVERNGRYYAQMRVSLPNGKTKAVRIPLEATRLDAAIAEAEEKRTQKRVGEVHLPGHRPSFSDLVALYKESAVFKSKKEGTRQNETQSLKRWIEQLGTKRIDWIESGDLSAFRDRRTKDGVTNRTINLDVTAFNNAMKFATEHEKAWISKQPRVKKLKEAPSKRRQLLTRKQIDLLLGKASVSANAELLRFYIRFLFSSGCREQEALRIRKSDVDMNREVVAIGADGDAKNRQWREVQFNDSLRTVLTEILEKLPDDCSWLFPSPQRGKKDIPAKSLRESFYLIRKEAKLDWVGFHDFRHFFASQCVMGGIDYMTIAKWLGHQDGGILVAKVYGHLNDEHQRKAAKKLTL